MIERTTLLPSSCAVINATSSGSSRLVNFTLRPSSSVLIHSSSGISVYLQASQVSRSSSPILRRQSEAQRSEIVPKPPYRPAISLSFLNLQSRSPSLSRKDLARDIGQS